jgi:hypothetical protein
MVYDREMDGRACAYYVVDVVPRTPTYHRTGHMDINWTDAGKTYRLKHGVFKVHEGYIETVYDDGTVSTGIPSFNSEQRARAVALGYESSNQGVWEMHKEHELLHSILSEAEGWPMSPSHYLWAKFGESPKGMIPREESLVFLLQRALNVGREIITEIEE